LTFTAIIVACIASFRALFVTKNNSRHVEEAIERDRELNNSPGYNMRIIKARAKHFHDSLFSTMKSSGDTGGTSITERALRNDSYGGDSLNKVESCRTEDVPTLNSHGLVVVTEPQRTKI
jgi:hypothetical protein